MKRLLIFVMLFIGDVAFSQTLTSKQENGIKSTVESQFGKLNNLTNLNLGRQVFCTLGTDTFYNPDGFHFLFRLTGDSLERIDSCVFHGGNFDRYLFTWHDRIYALGGYGFFTTNNNLEYFNPQKHEWSFEATTGEGPSFVDGIVLHRGDTLFCFNNNKGGNGVTKNVVDSALYCLDLVTMTWTKLNNENDDLRTEAYGHSFYSSDYVFVLSSLNCFLIRETNLQYVSLSSEEIGLIGWDDHYAIDKNILTIGVLGRGPDDRKQLQLDLDSIWAKNEDSAKAFLVEPVSDVNHNHSNNLTWYAIGSAFVLLTSGIFIYKKRKNKPLPDTPNDPEEPAIVQKLRKHPKRILTVEDLDEVLEIAHMESDSKKLKRHRMLSELDAKYPGMILRVKDETDKRRYLYRITLSQETDSQS